MGLAGAKNKSLGLALIWGLALSPLVGPAVSHAGEAELKAEIDRLWDKLAEMEVVRGAAAEAGAGPSWADRVTLSGVVEVEAGFNDGIMGDDTVAESDIALATMELAVDAEISEFSAAHVLFLYEDEENDNLRLDEATITLGQVNPLYLTAGRMYVPFGDYTSRMISDPLTLEMGETREDALLVGVKAAGFHASLYAFNGAVDNGGDDEIEHFGATAGFAFESETASVDVGAGWISNIRDSDGISGAPGGGPIVGGDYIAGYAAHLLTTLGPVTLIGEYVGADDEINGPGTNSRISAYGVEAGVSFPLAGKEGSFAVGYQLSDEAQWAGLPERRIVATLAAEIFAGTALALEWRNDEDYDLADDGTGTDWTAYTLQLAAEF
jgi:hypothetical protein